MLHLSSSFDLCRQSVVASRTRVNSAVVWRNHRSWSVSIDYLINKTVTAAVRFYGKMGESLTVRQVSWKYEITNEICKRSASHSGSLVTTTDYKGWIRMRSNVTPCLAWLFKTCQWNRPLIKSGAILDKCRWDPKFTRINFLPMNSPLAAGMV